MDWLQMEHRVLDEHIWSPCLHSQNYHQVDGNGPAQTIMGKAQPLGDWCWAFSVVHAQMGPRSNCECGAAEQTADHIILTCLTHRALTGIHGLTVLDDATRCWLNAITVSIWSRQQGSTSWIPACLWVDILPKELNLAVASPMLT